MYEGFRQILLAKKTVTVIYCAITLALFIHFLQFNNYSSDTVEYVGNVVALQTEDPILIHHLAYDAVEREAPAIVVPHILGTDLSTQEAAVRRDKHAHPYHFVGFLPYFSIKPLYIEALHLVHKTGVGLVRSIAVVSSISFLGIAVLVYFWVLKLDGPIAAACLVLLSPELTGLGRVTGPDALSVLFLLTGLFFVFELKPAVGTAILMASIWVRTDNAILVILVLAYLCFRGTLRKWMTLVLIAIAIATPMVINHFGGSAGWQALYLHTFYGELTPGQFVKTTFTAQDYLLAFRSGIREILNGTTILYCLLGLIGYILVPKMRDCIGLCVLFAVFKFIIYPNFEPRYYGVTFLVIGITACIALKQKLDAWGAGKP